MKKVALVICYYQHNYGSMLQAYATQKYLDNAGIPNEAICISGFFGEIKKAKLRYFASKIFHMDVIKDKWGFAKLECVKRVKRSLRQNIKLRDKAFDNFSKKVFRVSRVYTSMADIGSNAYDYSAFIVGSDQVWLPSNISAGYTTLSFLPDSIRKIAYASSFGISKLPKKQAEMAKQFLPRFDALSVREQSGKEMIISLIGRDVPIVADPTLLIEADEWNQMATKSRYADKPYIFCYFLGNNPLPRKFARRLKEKTGLTIVSLLHLDTYIKSDEKLADISPYDISPFDFLNLIKNAEYVCTDSFHGTVFSIQFEKKFFTFYRFKSETTMSTNNRLCSILKLLSLESRLISNAKEYSGIIVKEIDYNPVKEKINELRNYSANYIKQSLKDLEDDDIG